MEGDALMRYDYCDYIDEPKVFKFGKWTLTKEKCYKSVTKSETVRILIFAKTFLFTKYIHVVTRYFIYASLPDKSLLKIGFLIDEDKGRIQSKELFKSCMEDAKQKIRKAYDERTREHIQRQQAEAFTRHHPMLLFDKRSTDDPWTT